MDSDRGHAHREALVDVRIVVLGAGAMGSLMAGRLALAGSDVVLLGRPSSHLARIADTGLTLTEDDGSSRDIPLSVTTDSAAVAEIDLLVVLVKSWATAEALAPIRDRLPATAMVLTLQNGLGNVAAIRAALGDDASIRDVMIGVTAQAARREGAGVVRHTGDGPTAIGRPDGLTTPRLSAAATAFVSAGFSTVVVPDIERWVWRKLAVNAAINGPTALAGVPNGAIRSDPELRAAAIILAAEVAAIARARGIKLDHIAAAVDKVARDTALNRSSMLQDFDAHERTEVDAIYGLMIAESERLGIGVPASRVVAALIRAHEQTINVAGHEDRERGT
jgi:2-dehydropantoate 2-reductase